MCQGCCSLWWFSFVTFSRWDIKTQILLPHSGASPFFVTTLCLTYSPCKSRCSGQQVVHYSDWGSSSISCPISHWNAAFDSEMVSKQTRFLFTVLCVELQYQCSENLTRFLFFNKIDQCSGGVTKSKSTLFGSDQKYHLLFSVSLAQQNCALDMCKLRLRDISTLRRNVNL